MPSTSTVLVEDRPGGYRMWGFGPYPPQFDGYRLTADDVRRLLADYPVVSIGPRELRVRGLDGIYRILPDGQSWGVCFARSA